jgi:type I restriction enzyme S subunit
MSNWQKVALTEIYDISSGLSKSADSFGSGYPFLSFKDVFGNYFLPDELEQLVESTDKERERGSIRRGDVFLTRTSETMHELGMSSIALKDYPGATFNGFTKRLRPKENSSYEVHPEFIGYCLRSPSFRAGMLAFSTMSTRASLNNDMISRLVIQLPLIEVQKGIAKVLKSFDDKIQLNRQINQTLEAMAQAIFQSWFVDFDPVKAKITAREQWQTLIDGERSEWLNDILSKQAYLKTCLSELTANGEQSASETLYLNIAAMTAISSRDETSLADMPADEFAQLYKTASLFPERLVESELGEIPEGWEASTLGKHFDVVMGQSPKGDTYNEDGDGMVFFQGRRDFGFRYPTPRVYTTDPKRIAKAGDTLISVRAPVGDRNMARQECCLGRGVASIKHKSGARSFTFSFVGHIEKNLSESGSSGTVFSSINKNELSAVKFVAPNLKLLEAFESRAETLDQQVEINSEEIDTLEIMRDSLLPKLLSGEIDITV